jgi:uncharacterized cupin superfamily protein
MPQPVAIIAAEVPQRPRATGYPPDLAVKIEGRSKHVLGDLFGLANFGVNLTRLAPGAASSLRHAHSRQDEFVYIVQGTPTLVTNAGETKLQPGSCAGFPAGTGDAHTVVNRTDAEVVYLEVGDRSAGDVVTYPDDDLAAVAGEDGKWVYTRKDGSPL